MTGPAASVRAFLRWVGDWIYAVLVGFGHDDGTDGEKKARPR